MKLIFEKSIKGRKGVSLPKLDVPEREMPQKEVRLPELSELDVIRHFTELSRRNFGVDNGFYPLGSCTMKYNPKINEQLPEGFSDLHPYSPFSQGALELMYDLGEELKGITGMDAVTLQPSAGAHGELTGLMMIKKHFGGTRNIILTPDSSHGTNPASSSMCGLKTVTIKSNSKGQIDMKDLKEHLNDDVAAIMLTIPNTLGIFEEKILEITRMVHEHGSIVYMDGANMNALLGILKPADMGIDVMHLNLHKTFSTPHGGGGPGSGPVAVKKFLEDYLPNPRIEKNKGRYVFGRYSKSIGKVKAFYGNFSVLVKAYAYIKALGAEGLREVAENAVLNANYMKERLKRFYKLPYKGLCKHEFVISDEGMPNEISTNDIAKRLLDFGFHPPTVYFPLIVHGAMMIEPTETEGKEMLDSFIEAMIKIKDEANSDPDIVKTAPHTTVVKRLDAVKAAREPELRFKPGC